MKGEITDNSGENTAITVTIEAGNTVIASKTVTAGGTVEFKLTVEKTEAPADAEEILLIGR